MARFLLVRHALNDFVGRALAGWLPDVHLNAAGRAQAQALADRLADVPLAAVYTSPLDRCRETAHAIAGRHGLGVEAHAGVGEVRAGDWTGQRFVDLQQREDWQRYHRSRAGRRIPNGEMLPEVQARMVAAVEELRVRHEAEERAIVIVSHADPIKLALAYYLGIPLELFGRLEVSPASLSLLEVTEWGAQVPFVNWVPEPEGLLPSGR
jgi:probable phosphoglycerate mutase